MPNSSSRDGVEKGGKKVFLAGLIFLLLTGSVSLWSAAKSINTFRWVDHTHNVLAALENTHVAILDVETAARGFVIAADDNLLEPYGLGVAQARAALAEVRQLTTDNPLQQARVQSLDTKIEANLALAANRIEARRQPDFDLKSQFQAQRMAKVSLDEIRQQIQAMEQSESTLLAKRTSESQGLAHATIGVVLLGSCIAITFVGFSGFLVRRDFIRRKQAEDERDYFFSLSLELLCIAGTDGYFKRLNPAWEQALGFSIAELMAVPYSEWVHPDDRQATEQVGQKLLAGQTIVNFENRYRCKDGTYRWLLWSATSISNRQVIYGAARDITERKLADDEIQKLNETLRKRAAELELANHELESFSYSVSHDLRAPLRHAAGFVNLLTASSRPSLDEKARRYLNIIADSTKQMGCLIDDLLNFSRMSRSEMQQASVNFDLLVDQVIDDLMKDISGRKITWKRAHLPQIQGDGAMLKQVWVNLLSNALKYTRQKEEAGIEIGFRADPPGAWTFFIRDNGIGFDMRYSNKLFGVFQRLHRSEDFEGTGIGLANVRRIIMRHGGRTWAEGKINEGATFYFTLPQVQTGEPLSAG